MNLRKPNILLLKHEFQKPYIRMLNTVNKRCCRIMKLPLSGGGFKRLSLLLNSECQELMLSINEVSLFDSEASIMNYEGWRPNTEDQRGNNEALRGNYEVLLTKNEAQFWAPINICQLNEPGL